MPPLRTYRRRRRRGNLSPIERSRPPCQEEEHGSETASAKKHADHSDPLYAEEGHVASAQMLQEASSITASFSSSQQTDTVAQDTIEVLPPSGRCLSLSPVSHVWARSVDDWGVIFYIRVDLQGFFHTYPDVGGPFQSLEESDKAIDRHLDDRRDTKMRMDQDEVSPMEMTIRQCLYWPDGAIKKRTKSYLTKETHKRMCRFVRALVDKYNEDHNLLEDLALKLKDVLHYQSICEEHVWYYHLNFTTETNGTDDVDTGNDNLFFVEVKRVKQGKHGKHREMLVTCFCMVNPADNGKKCHGCTNHGTVDMKHPDTGEYLAGHLDVYLPFGGYGEWSDSEDDDEYVKAKEAKIRHMYKGLDDPCVIKELFTLPPGVTIVKD